jgi:hypothetical protein
VQILPAGGDSRCVHGSHMVFTCSLPDRHRQSKTEPLARTPSLTVPTEGLAQASCSIALSCPRVAPGSPAQPWAGVKIEETKGHFSLDATTSPLVPTRGAWERGIWGSNGARCCHVQREAYTILGRRQELTDHDHGGCHGRLARPCGAFHVRTSRPWHPIPPGDFREFSLDATGSPAVVSSSPSFPSGALSLTHHFSIGGPTKLSRFPTAGCHAHGFAWA